MRFWTRRGEHATERVQAITLYDDVTARRLYAEYVGRKIESIRRDNRVKGIDLDDPSVKELAASIDAHKALQASLLSREGDEAEITELQGLIDDLVVERKARVEDIAGANGRKEQELKRLQASF